MKYLNTAIVCLTLFAVSASPVVGQDEFVEKSKSIARMQKRVAEIESEMEKGGREKASLLGDEVFGLMGQIDSAYTQIKSSYEQQVIQLNQQMQRKWSEIEAGETFDRKKVNQQLAELEEKWDRTFERLTEVHDSHLDELKQSLAKVRGEFSSIAGKAQAELESSSFEAVARWEKGHELFLALNKTYAKIIATQLDWLDKKVAKTPDDSDLLAKRNEVRDRYYTIQEKLQKRLTSHIKHIEHELQTRVAQLNSTKVWKARRSIFDSIDDLYERADTTWENLEDSMLSTMKICQTESEETASDSRSTEAQTRIVSLKGDLKSSYFRRSAYVEEVCLELEERIAGSANVEEKAEWMARVTDLRLLIRELDVKAFRIDTKAVTLLR